MNTQEILPLSSLDVVLQTLANLGTSIVPIWGIDSKGTCLCSKKAECKSPGKHPHRCAPEGVNSATRDISLIKQWARNYPELNWAARCGEAMVGGGYLAAVDEDPRNGSVASIALLPELPETVTAKSGGNGRHRIFRMPHPPSSHTLGPGIDVQGVGKYLLIAPSNHHTGGSYQWELGQAPGEIDVATAPDWLVEGTDEAVPRPVRDGEATAAETVLGELFILSNMAGPVMPSGQMYVKCPNWKQHSDARGQGEDPSTVILPPAGGSQFGGWSCRHGHCANLKWGDILRMMPQEHVKAAQKKYPPRIIRPDDQFEPAETPAPDASEAEEDEFESLLDICRNNLSYHMTKSGQEITCDIVNAITILTYDPRWIGVLKWDEFAQVLRFVKQPQWHYDDLSKAPDKVWTDNNTTQLDAWMRRYWKLKLASAELAKAAYVVGFRDAVNPLRDWLSGLTWDKQPRLTNWLTRYLGVTSTPYSCSVARKWMISAVARGMHPGCKVDSVMILEGGQGVGKSTALRSLNPDESWFSDSPIAIGNKDAFVSLRGKWIIELAELASLSSTESEKTKSFFSSPADSYRPPYGREQILAPRSCVFAGSTNAGQYLKDETGGRRYWPIKVGVIDLQSLIEDKDQLWAEAVEAYKSGEQWHPSYEELPLFLAEQMDREISDAWEEDIQPWIASEQAKKILHDQGCFTLLQVAQHALGIETKDVNHSIKTRISRTMYHLGYKTDRARVKGSKVSAFIPCK